MVYREEKRARPYLTPAMRANWQAYGSKLNVICCELDESRGPIMANLPKEEGRMWAVVQWIREIPTEADYPWKEARRMVGARRDN